TFDFRATSTVNALAIIGNTLYLGGDFTGLTKTGGASTLRNRLAAIDLTTLAITSFNPDVDGEVFALAASGNTLYAGGFFTFVGATQRVGGAAFNTAAGGALTAWDPETFDGNALPDFLGEIRAIAPFGGTIYIGGRFTQAGGLATPEPRDHIAAVDPVSGAVTAWDPIASNGGGETIVRTIVPTASVVYLGGQFSALNNPAYTRVGLGAVSTATGAVTAWNPGSTPPNGGGNVRSLVLDGTTIYAGGEFTGIGSAARNYAAGIDTTTFAITQITQSANLATAQVASTAGLVTGGFITIAGAGGAATQTNYNGIKQITVTDATHFTFTVPMGTASPATGTLTYAKNDNATAFNPNLDGDTHVLAAAGTNVLAGGTFLKADSVPNPAFGGFAKASGTRTIDGYVYDTASAWSLVRQADGKTIVAGDYFLDTGGVFYRGLIRLNTDDTLDTGWNPSVQGQVVTASLGPAIDNTVLIGGTFTKIGATARRNLAAVSLSTGLATAFDANVNGVVNKVLVDGSSAYIGGRFTQVGGNTRLFIAAVHPTTGALLAWYPAGGSNGFVETLAVDGSNVYLGGDFFNIGGQPRPNVAKASKATGVVDGTWNPGADEKVFGLTVVGSTVYVSGNFQTLAGQPRNFTGAVNATTGAATAWDPNPDFVVLKVTPAVTPSNTLYISGAFLNVNGTQTGTAAAVNDTTGALRSWFPILNDSVYDLLPDATRVLTGGVFVSSGLVPRLSLAGFSIAGVPDAPTGVAAAGGNTFANVSFSPPANNGGNAITSYTATCTPTAGVPVAASGLASPVNVPGLTNGVTYTCTVHATNSVGNSGESAASNSVIPAAGPPVALTVTLAGTGTGTVSSAPAGIACPGDCAENYAGGTGVQLTAAATGGSVFSGWLGGGCTGAGATCDVTLNAATAVSATFAPPGTVFDLDIDLSPPASNHDALTDGLLILRYMFGLTGPSLTVNALNGLAARTDPATIKTYLDNIRPRLDVDGSSTVEPKTDGMLILRYLFGLRGNALIAGALHPQATRTAIPDIEAYIQALLLP
ncbi:MAG: fibronectin type III domain-containing protein, partial [Burkholderiales bacterium]|nr:fibronectin type III domain-containing protein [Burkholderiales bacterium]